MKEVNEWHCPKCGEKLLVEYTDIEIKRLACLCGWTGKWKKEE